MLSELANLLATPWGIFIAIFFLAASIFVHEYGHYLAARWRGLKIERFSIFFGPKLFGWKDKDGVQWQVSAIPLGGYVALPQLADLRGVEGETQSDAEALPPLSYTDKVVVAAAGAVFNLIFALALSTVLWITGMPAAEEALSTTVGYIEDELNVGSRDAPEVIAGPALKAGLKPGDTILAIDGRPVHDWSDIQTAIVVGSGRDTDGAPEVTLTVERAGETLVLQVAPALVELQRAQVREVGILPAQQLRVGQVYEHSPAAAAGLQTGDVIATANGTALHHPLMLTRIVRAAPEEPVRLGVERDGQLLELSATAQEVQIRADGQTAPLLGIGWSRTMTTRHVDPFSQIYRGVDLTITTVAALLNPRTNIDVSHLSGPIGIVRILTITAQQGVLLLLWIVVIINVNLAILNLLPIPVLDGGHILFATLTKLRGRPLPASFISAAQGAVMILLLSLFLYVSFFDVLRVKDDAAPPPENTYIQPVFSEDEG